MNKVVVMTNNKRVVVRNVALTIKDKQNDDRELQ